MHMIELCTEEDLDWMVKSAATLYKKGVLGCDDNIAEFLRKIMSSPDCVLIKCNKTVMGAMVMRIPYNREVSFCSMLITATAGRPSSSIVRMTKWIMAWAKYKGASYLQLSSATCVDFGPLAKSLGGFETAKQYRVDL